MVIIKQGHLKREAKIEKYEVSVLFQIQNSIRNNPADLNSVFLLINKLCGKCYTSECFLPFTLLMPVIIDKNMFCDVYFYFNFPSDCKNSAI